LVLWVRPGGGNERFDPTRERDGFRNLLHEGQIPQCRRHLRQTPGRSSAAMQCHQHAQMPQGRAVTCV
jgi:hypothetical protein